jgi:CBS domain containing-hemolysin-like protein
LGEIIPKSVFQQHADRLVPIIAPPLNIAFKMFYPVVFLVSTITNRLLHVFGVEKREHKQTFTRGELKYLISSDAQGTIADRQRQDMMRRVFEFGDTTVEEILVPLVEVYALEKGTTIPEAIKKVQECGFSRIPIYEERIDRLIGVIHAFDLLRATPEDRLIDRFIRKAYYVPKTMQLVELVQNMQRHHTQIAIVVNEYGGSLGLVSFEDSLEEIVGNIDDEFDELLGGKAMYQKLSDGSFRIHARMEIDEVQEILKLELPEGAFETFGGFLLSEFRHIPTAGEFLEHQGFLFTVEEATERAIIWVHVSKR